MNDKRKQFRASLIFLMVFGLTVFGIFFLGQRLSKSQDPIVSSDYESREPGKVVLTEFSDFQCPACRLYAPLVKQLRAEYGDKLVFVYKHFPLKSIHKNAELAGRAGEAAKLQGKFDEMSDTLFANQDSWANSGSARETFIRYAESLNLDKEKFSQDMDSEGVRSIVNKDYQEALRLGLRGTPTFMVNGKVISNPTNYDEFKSIIDNAIK